MIKEKLDNNILYKYSLTNSRNSLYEECNRGTCFIVATKRKLSYKGESELYLHCTRSVSLQVQCTCSLTA